MFFCVIVEGNKGHYLEIGHLLVLFEQKYVEFAANQGIKFLKTSFEFFDLGTRVYFILVLLFVTSHENLSKGAIQNSVHSGHYHQRSYFKNIKDRPKLTGVLT